MSAQIKHVAIMVKDLDQSVEFYQRVFGLDFVANIDPGDAYKQRIANLTDGQQAISLIQPIDRPYRSWEYETLGVNHVGFLVESLEETVEKLQKEPGVTDLHQFDVEGCPIAKFRDINGTEIDVADGRYRVWMECGPPFGAADVQAGSSRHRIAPQDLSQGEGPEPIAATGAKAMDFMAVMMRNDGLYGVWRPLARYLIANSALSLRERELLILRTACVARSAFEWGNHVLVSREAGIDDKDIASVRDNPASEDHWSTVERAILRVPDELHSTGTIRDSTWQILVGHFNDEQLLEVLLLVAHYLGVAFIANTASVQIPDGVPGFDVPARTS
jgi:4-carboxymuconolactone decarboxylase